MQLAKYFKTKLVPMDLFVKSTHLQFYRAKGNNAKWSLWFQCVRSFFKQY